MSLFGAPQPKPTLSLFGTTSQPSQQPSQQPSSLFGASAPPPQRPTLSLFGASSTPASNTTTQPQTSSLFASTSNPQQQQPAIGGGSGLFGGASAPAAAQKPSLFSLGGNATQPQPTGMGLFGSSNAQPQQPTQPSLFGSSAAPAQVAPAQQSILGLSNNAPALGQSSIWNPGSFQPREKSIPDQMQTLLEKWDPSSSSCAFQHYFYNHVPEEQAPYYAPAPGEDETKWEEALKKKPSPGAIPVLARGPLALGRRLEIQAMWVRGIQSRLHELNEILTRRLQAHDLQYSVRAAEARRKHVVLSRRCLSLATKVQVLRNRGYAMDGAEEQLRVNLQKLERLAFDPMVSGRQEEIWARMSVLRERAQLLKTETDKLAKDISATNGDGPLDEEQMKRVEKILSNYETQLGQLKKERDSAEKDFADWQAATQTGVTGGR